MPRTQLSYCNTTTYYQNDTCNTAKGETSDDQEIGRSRHKYIIPIVQRIYRSIKEPDMDTADLKSFPFDWALF